MDKQRPTLFTERLVLRPFTLADAPDVQRLAGAREVAEMTANIPHPYEDGMAEEWISTHQERFERGEALTLAITRRSDGALVGAIGLVMRAQDARAELGYWIGVPYWGQGYCTEAARALVEYAFEHLGLHRIHATHLKRNPASGRVMQKIGMACEGCLREHLQKWGVFEDMVQYGLLASEWRAHPLEGVEKHARACHPERREGSLP
jgi:ribosomal-protein-alanine N-acetyltransferase